MGEFWRDGRLAVRRLAKAPLFTVFSVVTLALGIGITTAAYSILYSMFWRDPVVADSATLVSVRRQLSWPDYQDLVRQQTALSGVAAYADFGGALATATSAELISGQAVSGNYFQVIGIGPAVGRLLQAADDQPGASDVVVLSTATWRSQFGADPDVVGSSARIAGRVFQIVGVAPDRFNGIDIFPMRPVAAWIPLEAARYLGAVYERRMDPGNRDTRWLSVVARLADGRSRGDAERDIAGVAARLDQTAPLRPLPDAVNTRNPLREWTVTAALDRSRLVGVNEATGVVLAVPALVLLVACTNLANLVLSRGVSRRQEHAVRQALGASRWRLIRASLLESAAVATAGGVAGAVVALGLLRLASAILEDTFGFLTQFRLEARLEPSVMGAAGVAMALALVVAGLAPALNLTRGDLHKSLTVDAASNTLLRWRGRANLIALQVAVSVFLFLLTALALRLLPSVTQRPGPGRDLDRAALVEVPLRLQQTDETRARLMVDEVLAEAARVPGIEAVAASNLLRPSSVRLARPDQRLSGDGDGVMADRVSGTPGFFGALNLPLVAGRVFDERDVAGAPAVAVVNESLARALFGGVAGAVGRDVQSRPANPDFFSIDALTVIGVVADSTLNNRGQTELIEYRPFAQHYDPDITFIARSSVSEPDALVNVLRTAVRRANPDAAVLYAGSAEARFRLQAMGIGLAIAVVGSLATLALVLAMAGLYGVLSHVVLHRTREIGVRVALGADQGHITRLVLRDGVRPVAEGLFIGLGAAALIRMILQTGVTQAISPFDPVATAVAVGPLLVAAAAACYLPARRAARVDPNVALRQL